MTKEGRPWKEEPCLYWFTNNDYANNEKLLVEARADLDPIWSKAENYYNSAGYGEITKNMIVTFKMIQNLKRIVEN